MFKRFLCVVARLPADNKMGRLNAGSVSECRSFSRNVATPFTHVICAISMRMSGQFVAQRDKFAFSMFSVSPFNQGAGVVQSVLWLDAPSTQEHCPQNVQTGSGTHKDCYSVGRKGSFLGAKLPALKLKTPQSSSKIRMSGVTCVYLHRVHRDKFTVLLYISM